ncbi:hypothetical protein LTR36_001787 [Oleoguttula mirabilis]|uniref:Uncharacterized protein n=1 Tax=Oleoguttula mirabilis TaxID=1507867 RepID=A0AAV9JM29_9PEZI|nr:hypothetical protein LTR36_001787 [Oleoguttula mirabilis]
MSHFGTNDASNFENEQRLDPNFFYDQGYPPASYEPRLFGHPHKESTQQQGAEPFWYQHPEWIQPGHQLFYYPGFGQYFTHPINFNPTMDTKTTYIGSGVNRKGTDGEKLNADGSRYKPKPKPEMVEIYIGDTFVKQMQLRTVTRFSTLASETFPRPNTVESRPKSSTEESSEAEDGSASKKWADDKGGKVNVKKLTEEIKNLPMPSDDKLEAKNPTTTNKLEAKNPTSTDSTGSDKAEKAGKTPATVPMSMAHKGPEAAKSTKKFAPPQKKALILGDAELALPNLAAVRTCLDWMNDNQIVHGNQKLRDFHVPEGAPLNSLVNMYQAALCLGMRPFPRHLEDIIKEIVTDSPPTADMLHYMYERLPVCPVLTRIMTSCIQHEEKRHYNQEDFKAIQALVAGDEWLSARFEEIQSSRIARRKEQSGKKRMESGWAALEKDLEAEKDGLGARMAGRIGQTSATTDKGVGQGSGRQRNRRQQKGSDQAKTGKDVKDNTAASEQVPEKTNADSDAVKQKPEIKKEGNGKGVRGAHVPGA